MGFVLVKDRQLELGDPSMPGPLAELLAYWDRLRGGRAMPRRADIDPAGFAHNLGRVHLLKVEGPGRFRYRVYGSNVTNPDAADMTGKTTQDYKDQAFGDMVTRHLARSVEDRRPICMRVIAQLDGEPYEYERIALPLSGNADAVEFLMVGTFRERIPRCVQRGLSGTEN